MQVFLRSGQLAIYEALSGGVPPDPPIPLQTSSLSIKFVKILSKTFEIQRPALPYPACSLRAIVRAGFSRRTKVESNCIHQGMLLYMRSHHVPYGSRKGIFYFTQTRCFTFPECYFVCNLTSVSRDQVCWNGSQISTWMDLCFRVPCRVDEH